MSFYIPAYSDVFVKYLLGSEQNKDLLLSFINSVLTDSGFAQIVNIEIKNPFNLKEFKVDKESILDIKAVDENGKQYDIEVQSTGDEKFKNRSLYYWAKLYVSQLKEKETFVSLRPAICINVVNFNLFPELTSFHNCFLLKEKENNEYVLTDHVMLHFLELPKIKNENIITKLEHWLYFLKHEGLEEDKMKILIQDDKDLAKAHREYNTFTYDDKLREIYEQKFRYNLERNSDLETARLKGIEEGIEKGQISAKLEDAQKMHELGMTTEQILAVTGLSRKQLQQAGIL